MSVEQDILNSARHVFEMESRAIADLKDRINSQFVRAVREILTCRGRVIVTGIGKSGLIGKKITATLASTGTPSFFLHPAEAIHGDLGMVTASDVIICLSKSGNTGEISAILPMLKQLGVTIITITGNERSALAERSDIVLNVYVAAEACPNDLAPTASTAAMLAMGDALAISLLKQRGFEKEDFAFLHPGGSLGRQLLPIKDIMFSGAKVPRVDLNAPLETVILEITKKRFGCTCVIAGDGALAGLITDGDLRRLWQSEVNPKEVTAEQIMNPTPKVILESAFAKSAFQMMEQHNIMQVVVIDGDRKPVGMVHLHDLLEAGIGSQSS